MVKLETDAAIEGLIRDRVVPVYIGGAEVELHSVLTSELYTGVPGGMDKTSGECSLC